MEGQHDGMERVVVCLSELASHKGLLHPAPVTTHRDQLKSQWDTLGNEVRRCLRVCKFQSVKPLFALIHSKVFIKRGVWLWFMLSTFDPSLDFIWLYCLSFIMLISCVFHCTHVLYTGPRKE